MPLVTEIGIGPGDFVLDGTQLSSPPPKGHKPYTQLLAHVYCDQTAGLINVPLCTEVGLGPDDVVSDGDPAPPKRGTASQFSAHVCCGETAGWMKMPLVRK